MGVYIKVDGNCVPHVAGEIANQRMLDEGYFEYNGDIPVGASLKYVNETVVADNTLAKSEAKKVIAAKYQVKFEELKSSYLAKIGLGTTNEATFRTQYQTERNNLITELNNVGV
jgi:hypothetical protein